MLHTNRLPRVAGMAVAIIVACTANVARCDDADSADRNSNAGAGDAVEIPLDEIWALDMPGTRSLEELFAEIEDDQQRQRSIDLSLARLRRVLARKPAEETLPGAALYKTGRRGLMGANVYLGKNEPEGDKVVDARHPPTLLFFSHPSAYRVQLVSVERCGRKIDIAYRFVPQYTVEAKPQLALIPLSKLPPGKYDVAVTKLPMDEEFLDAGFEPVSEEAAKRLISRPFSFTVVEPPAPAAEPATDAQIVPLDEFWAYQMPGGKDIRNLEPEAVRTRHDSLVKQILRALATNYQTKDPPGPGFAVVGQDYSALKQVRRLVATGKRPAESFAREDKLSLFFFTYPSSRYVHISRVEIHEDRVDIYYKFVPHIAKYSTIHFALIPLETLSVGKYQVRLIREPLEDHWVRAGFNSVSDDYSLRVICKPFSFTVKEQQ